MVAGCDALFGLDLLEVRPDAVSGDALTDAARPVDVQPDCLFAQRELLYSGGAHDPTLSADRTELFYAYDLGTGYDIYQAVRSDTNQPFAAGGIVGALTSAGNDTDPALTADGLLVVFISDRGGTGPRAYQAKRGSIVTAFSAPQLVPGLENTPVSSVDVSPDGLTLYYDDGARLRSVSRTARDQPILVLQEIAMESTPFPSLSADGLELYYNGPGVMRRTRHDTSSSFDLAPPVSVDDGGADADLLPDGSALVLTGGNGSDVVYLRERCR
jgi:hypothetical protein